MTGLLNNNYVQKVLTEWYKIFIEENSSHSIQAIKHWKEVERLGIPNCKDEDWKYTSLKKLLSYQFIKSKTIDISTVSINFFSLKLNFCRLVFINGCFIPSLSDNDTDLWEIKVEKGIKRQLVSSPIYPEVFLHLTESLNTEITVIRLPENKIANRHLYLLHISCGNNKVKNNINMHHYRHHIEIGFGAKGQIIEHFVGDNKQQKYFTGARTTITVGNNSFLKHIKLICENEISYYFGHDDINIGCCAVCCSTIFVLGSAITKHQTSVQLNGRESNIITNSLLLSTKENISDIRTYIEHNKPYCKSRQLHKIISRDYGKGVFIGLIKVAKNAYKTDGKIINNNLLLSQSSEINAKPQLEIYADDVRCSHGVTMGCIDEEQIFYMCTRGILYEKAKQIVICAFVEKVVENIDQKIIRKTITAYIVHFLQKKQ